MMPAVPTVLVVDDEDLFRMTVADLLRQSVRRRRVLEAADGEEALRLLDREAVGCLVTDLAMPGLDGVGLLLEVLARGWAVPVVVVSAHGDAARGVTGAPRHVKKPVDLDVLEWQVRRALVDASQSRPGVTALGILQVMAWEGRTCSVRVASGADPSASGELLLIRGRVEDARFGNLAGLDAAVRLMAADEPMLALHAPFARPPASLDLDVHRLASLVRAWRARAQAIGAARDEA